jgi:hypothetical protein
MEVLGIDTNAICTCTKETYCRRKVFAGSKKKFIDVNIWHGWRRLYLLAFSKPILCLPAVIQVVFPKQTRHLPISREVAEAEPGQRPNIYVSDYCTIYFNETELCTASIATLSLH